MKKMKYAIIIHYHNKYSGHHWNSPGYFGSLANNWPCSKSLPQKFGINISFRSRICIQVVPFTFYLKWMAVALKLYLSVPVLLKPKCVWYIEFLKNLFIFYSCLFKVFQKNLQTFKHVLAFTNIWSNMDHHKATGVYFMQKVNGTPCRLKWVSVQLYSK